MFKAYKIFILFGLLHFGSPNYLFSSHLTGGKITYRYLGTNKYEITLAVYRDCSVSFPFDSPAYISIFSKANNSLVYNKGLAIKSQSTIPALAPNPCFVPPAGICLEIGTYVDTVQLAPNGSGYTIAYQRCCRNITVLNLVQPSQNGITITTDIPPQVNNTPKFLNFPPIFICFSDTFNYSFASTDADGDNLVYQLCSPLVGASNLISASNPASPPPYLPVTWSNTFTATNPIPNNGGFNFNTSTGQLKFKPSMLGQYSIGICVLEYRNNILINTNRLELQFNIVPCYLTSSIPTASNLCQGLTIPFQNASTNANAFHWNFGDPTTNADTSNLFSPTYTYPAYGTYTVSLTVLNTAYGFCKDSTKKVINVHPLLSPTLQATYSSCFKNNNFNFNVGGSFDPSSSFNWNFTANSSSPNTNINNTTAHFTTSNTKTVSVIINQFGCIDTLNAVVSFTNPIAGINDANLNCNEKNLFFPNFSANANNFFWDFGDLSTSNDTSSISNPTYSYSNYGTYTVTLIANSGVCSDTLKKEIKVFPKLTLDWLPTIQKQCLKGNSFNFIPTGIWSGNATFNWLFYDSPAAITSTLQNPTNIQFTNAGNHLIKYSVSENGCVKNAQGLAIVYPNPKINVSISDSIGCEPLTIKFKNLTDSTKTISHLWNINGNTFSTDSINYLFNNSGIYSYNLIITDTNNCKDSVSKNNWIKINPKPHAILYANPLQTSLINSNVTLIDSTTNSHSTVFNFGNGNTSSQTYNSFYYQEAGIYPVSLIVKNQFGCSDTATTTIYIDDIGSKYIPNVFTPNNDGANDIFKIKGESVTSSSMRIFNRWGTEVFYSENALLGWNGVNKNNNLPCDDGTYFYVIVIKLNHTKEYTFKGNVSLFR